MYAFFLDLDGTIYNSSVSSKTVEILKKAQSAGHRVFINTARHYHSLPTEIINLPFDGFICSFGTTVFAEGNYLQRVLLPGDMILHFAKYAFQNGVQLDFISEDIRLRINNSIMPGIDLENAAELSTRYKEAKITKMVGRGDYPQNIYNHFKEYCDVYGEKPYFEAVSKGYSKSSGIRFIEEYYGIAHENTVAIGDGKPDLDMLAYAGIGIAMGNGIQGLKDNADYITDHVFNDGAAVAMDCVINGDLSPMLKR